MVEQSSEPLLLPFLCCLSHTAQSLGHSFPALCRARVGLSDVLLGPRAFPPQPPPRMAPLCSAGSSVLRRSPTPPERACPPYGFAPSRTGLAPAWTETLRRSPGSRACCFSACAGFLDYAGPAGHSRFIATSRVAFPNVGMEFSALVDGFSKLNRPAHRYPCLRFDRTPRDARRKTRGQDGFAFSFLVGLFHSLQHAGLSRRTPVSATMFS